MRRLSSCARDKKRVGATLRSVIICGKGRVEVTTEVSAAQWYDALCTAHDTWAARPIRVGHIQRAHGRVELAASKSELNRALVIESLRPGPTAIAGPGSSAQDVVALRVALRTLRAARASARVDAGLGGTTFRFLVGVALVRDAPTTITAHEKLLERPHQALFEAARAAGARITPDAQGVRVTPARATISSVSVRCDESSQYASALALMAASGRSLELVLSTREGGGYAREDMASVAYFEMTLELLRQAGVQVSWEGALVRLSSPRTRCPTRSR